MLHANPADPPMLTRAFGLPILVLSGLQLMVVLDGTIVIFALPRMQEQLGLSTEGSSWVITSYALSFAGLMLLGGRVGDAFGRRRMLLIGVAVFTAASLLCGLAVNESMLIAARAIQGLGAALASPTAFALVATTFAPGLARNRAISVFAAMVGVGSIAGLVIGGALVHFDWRWIFLINVPIGILILIAGRFCLRDTEHQRLSLDVRGAVLATLGCTALVFGGTEGPALGWTSPWIIGSLTAAAVLLVAFVITERSVDNPLLPWSLFDTRDRVAAFVGLFFAGAALTSMTVYMAQFLQNILHYSALNAGVACIPFTLGIGVGSGLSSKLTLTVAPRWLIGAGAALLVAALAYGAVILGDDVPYLPTLLVLLSTIGFAIGLIVVPLPLCFLVGVDPREIGPLAAVGQVIMNIGGPMSLGVITPLVVSRTLSLGGTNEIKPHEMTDVQLTALSSGYTLALTAAAVAAAVAGLVAVTIRYSPTQVAQAQAAQEASERG